MSAKAESGGSAERRINMLPYVPYPSGPPRDVLAISAIGSDLTRRVLALVGRYAPNKRGASRRRTTHFRRLIEQEFGVDTLEAVIGDIRPVETIEPGRPMIELSDGYEWQVFVDREDDPAFLVNTALRGIRQERFNWEVLRTFPPGVDPYEQSSTGDDSLTEQMRSAMARTFEQLAALGDLQYFTIDKSGHLLYNSGDSAGLSTYVVEHMPPELREYLESPVVAGAPGAHSLAKDRELWKERSSDDMAEAIPTSESIVGSVVEQMQRVKDPLARIVLMDELADSLMDAVYGEGMAAAAEFRDAGGTWVEIGKELGVTPPAAQMRLDPASRAKNLERSRARRRSAGDLPK